MHNYKALLAAILIAASPCLFAAQDRTEIHPDAFQVQPLLPGMDAPAFGVLDAEGKPVRFDPASLERPMVLTFFRGGWCPYCNLHLAEMRHAEAELKNMGFDIWFVSIDRPQVLYASLEQPDIGYRLLSDSKLEATRAFGLAFRLPDDLVERYLEWDIDIEGAAGENHHVMPAPSTFIIGRDGVIRFQYTNPDYKVSWSFSRASALLHGLVIFARKRAPTRRACTTRNPWREFPS
jgi:peroxiredoxin